MTTQAETRSRRALPLRQRIRNQRSKLYLDAQVPIPHDLWLRKTPVHRVLHGMGAATPKNETVSCQCAMRWSSSGACHIRVTVKSDSKCVQMHIDPALPVRSVESPLHVCLQRLQKAPRCQGCYRNHRVR